MSFDFLRSATASSSAYRVVCGEMIIDSNMWNVHNEVLVAVVRDGYMTVEMGADTYSLSTGDIYFISPNQRYKINNTGNARVDVILLNLSNPASLTQEFIPQSLITAKCTTFSIFFSHRDLLRFVMLRLRAKSTVLSAELRNISTTTSATALLLIQ